MGRVGLITGAEALDTYATKLEKGQSSLPKSKGQLYAITYMQSGKTVKAIVFEKNQEAVYTKFRESSLGDKITKIKELSSLKDIANWCTNEKHMVHSDKFATQLLHYNRKVDDRGGLSKYSNRINDKIVAKLFNKSLFATIQDQTTPHSSRKKSSQNSLALQELSGVRLHGKSALQCAIEGGLGAKELATLLKELNKNPKFGRDKQDAADILKCLQLCAKMKHSVGLVKVILENTPLIHTYLTAKETEQYYNYVLSSIELIRSEFGVVSKDVVKKNFI